MTRIFNFPWVSFLERLYDRTIEADLFSRAAQTAFYFQFSIFPLLFFLVSLFGLILNETDGLRVEIFSYLRQIMPTAAFDLVRRTIDEVAANSSGSKLLLGMAVSVWSASAGVDTIRGALNAIYGFRDRRSWLHTKSLSIALTLGLILMIAAILLIVFYGWQLVQTATASIGIPVTSPSILSVIQWVSILAVMLFACELFYNLLPDFRMRKWIWITAGSVVAIVSWLLLTGGFRLYLAFFNSYDLTYGSLGAVIILMLWLYLTGLVLMIGGVINSVLHEFAVTSDDAGTVTNTEGNE